MKDVNTLRFILHVSDFHLTDSTEDVLHAKKALKTLTEKLKQEKIKVDYLVHTGDVINSSDIFDMVAKEQRLDDKYFTFKENETPKFNKKVFMREADKDTKKKFDDAVKNIVEKRFEVAADVMRKFISDLNISFGSVVICCGNHDVLRPFMIDDSVLCEKENDKWNYTISPQLSEIFTPFENFLNNLGVANSQSRCEKKDPITICTLDNLNFLILNTNWKNPKAQKEGCFCVNCENVRKSIDELSQNADFQENINIVLAHKPIYEICEKTRLAYKRYIKTPFMNDMQKFTGENGLYFCGDKHTRSIIASQIHDIPHYFSGEPFNISKDKANEVSEVEYNLLEVSKNKLGMERKIHLRYTKDCDWSCEIRPQDMVVSKLYKLSKKHIVRNAFETIAGPKDFDSWETLCQEIYSWNDGETTDWFTNINNLFLSVCKYRKNGVIDTTLKGENIFSFVLERIKIQMNDATSENLLNIRGENSSGKSTFLGLLYIFLLYQYSVGKINFIPAYFNLESTELENKIKYNSSYYDAVKDIFEEFTKKIQNIALKEHHSICYIIDGLDEQDCWSYTTEDSVGRCILDVLSQYSDSHYIMSFSQQRLPSFKNTMPSRKYNDISDIMYFNPIDVRESGAEDDRFVSFVEAFLKLKKFGLRISDNVLSKKEVISGIAYPNEINDKLVEDVCDIIRKFRRLTITPGFMYQNYNYIASTFKDNNELRHINETVPEIYGYYIDRQYEICLNKLGYGFVKYAPVMAYLFAYKGYTYEKFKHLNDDGTNLNFRMHKPIYEHYDKIYNTFLFIKKHKDAREYLIALHYNRELRYFAENLEDEIEKDSILNEFISRNISVIIRKLWNDTNKFIIVCEQLLKRKDLSNCTLSTLIYCLAHLKIYSPFKDRLYSSLREKSEENHHICFPQDKQYDETEQDEEDLLNEDKIWNIKGFDNAQKLDSFIELSLMHSIKLFELMDKRNSESLVKSILQIHSFTGKKESNFQIYNRQYQMLYYGDLSIQGEDKKRLLNPGVDEINKGFDFHNCFNFLYVKLSSQDDYPLREYDMFTICDLVLSRLLVTHLAGSNKESEAPNTFFYRKAFSARSTKVLQQTKEIVDKYLNDEKVNIDKNVLKFFKDISKLLQDILKGLKKDNPCREIQKSFHEFDEQFKK